MRKTTTLLIFVLAAFAYAAEAPNRTSYRVPSGGMEPTIRIGEHVIVNLEAYRNRLPQRGEIIAYRAPTDPKATLLKRVVGLPLETVEMRHKQLYVNGKPLSEPYAVHSDAADYTGTTKPEPYRSRDSFSPVKLALGDYFVLGDNRDSSADSRYFGAVAISSIVGRAERAIGPEGGERELR